MEHLFARAPLVLVVACAGALATAFVSQYAFGLEPCPLCLYQRAPYVFAAFACLATLVGGIPVRTALWVAAAFFTINAGIATYHVGVEQHWWASAVCGGGVPDIATGDDLMAALQQKPEKACDEVEATLFGISMATYNVAASVALAAFALRARTWLMRVPAQ